MDRCHSSTINNEINNEMKEVKDTTVRDFDRAMELLSECSLVLGMHPDQAAGPIVKYAVQYQKSFAVVPCCVYSKEFPKRKLLSKEQKEEYSNKFLKRTLLSKEQKEEYSKDFLKRKVLSKEQKEEHLSEHHVVDQRGKGKRVTSYEDLCTYLMELAPPGEIKKCIVPHLDGKNVCLYRIVKKSE